MTELYSQILYLHLRNKNIKKCCNRYWIIRYALCMCMINEQVNTQIIRKAHIYYQFFVRLWCSSINQRQLISKITTGRNIIALWVDFQLAGRTLGPRLQSADCFLTPITLIQYDPCSLWLIDSFAITNCQSCEKNIAGACTVLDIK